MIYYVEFEISGTFASWRDSYSILVLKSNLYPSNTQIIGIISAAMGISEEKKMLNIQEKILGIGIRGLWKNNRIERIFMTERLYNFTHLSDMERYKTIESWEYLINPKYRILILTKEEEFAKKIYYFLEKPEYPIYLGRSEMFGKIEKIDFFQVESLEMLNEVENTHVLIENFQHPIDNSLFIITKKLIKYGNKRKLIDENNLKQFVEIVGRAKVKDVLGIKSIPIIAIKSDDWRF